MLMDDEQVVGFVATTFSELATIRGEKAKRFCNMSSWIVKDAYRGQSLALLSNILARRGLTITNLSPTPQVLKICQKLGFKTLDKSERIILPSPAPALWRNVEVLTDRRAIEGALRGEPLKILRDHQLPHNRHALVCAPEGSCHVVMNRTWKTLKGKLRLPMGRVHHVSAPDLFVRYLDRLDAVGDRTHFRVVALVVDELALGRRSIWHSIRRPGGPRTGAFRSDEVGEHDIDGLYSEAVLLNY